MVATWLKAVSTKRRTAMNNTEPAIETGAQTLHDKAQTKKSAAIVYQNSVFLVVDDFEIMRKVTAEQLKSLGAKKILVANNGVEALRILHAQHVDIVLSDWNMPLLSGLDLLKAVRCDEQLYRLPFVMIMSEIERKRVEQAIASGVSALVLKPYTGEHLAMRIDKAMEWTPQFIPASALHSTASILSSDSTGHDLLVADIQQLPDPAQRPNILIVDDAADNLHMLSEIFKDEYKVRVAHKGVTALEICFSVTPPDLVLLDILMPDMDGFEVARRMREHPVAATIPIIFVTALSSESARLQGLALGAVDFITKPIDTELLKPRVRNFMRYVALHKQLQADYDGMLEIAQIKKQADNLNHNEIERTQDAVNLLVKEFAADDSKRSTPIEAQKIEEAGLRDLNFTDQSTVLLQIETGRYKLITKQLKIADILQHTVEISRANYARKHLTIALDIDVPVPQALADSMLSNFLFQNLIDNACEAAPEFSNVAVKLYDRNPLRILIENKGVVPASRHTDYFKKTVTHDLQEDTVLRTYAAKLLCQAQGGQIELVVSEETDTTTVIVNLPRANAHESETAKVLQDEGTNRIEAFSDGVFAIAMTLLVLEIKLPLHSEVAEYGLAHTLVALWPSYLAFITSFITILVIWVRHHWMFTLIKRTDPPFLYWNGLLLFFITFLPFPTALLAEYLLHPQATVAASLYTGTVLAISLAFKALWRHATRNKVLLALFETRAASSGAKLLTLQGRLGPPLYLIAFGISFFSEGAAIAVCLMLTLFFASRDWLAQK
jgi:two-component system sensor histidine kinase/response regulator